MQNQTRYPVVSISIIKFVLVCMFLKSNLYNIRSLDQKSKCLILNASSLQLGYCNCMFDK